MENQEKQANIRKTVFFVTIVAIIAKLVGFLREFVLSRIYTPNDPTSDGYIIAARIPITVFAFVATAISSTYIVIYTRLAETDKKRAREFSNSILTVFLVIAIVTSALLSGLAKYVVYAFAPKSAERVREIATLILRIAAPSLIFMVCISTFTSYLEYKNKFILTNFISLPGNIVLIVCMFLSAKAGYWLLGFGILGAYIIEMIFLIPALHKTKFTYKVQITKKNPDLREALLISLPILLSSGLGKINTIVDQQFASFLHSTGSISLLNYGHVISNGILQILTTGFIAVFFANITKLIAANKKTKVQDSVSEAVGIINFFLIPAFLGLILYGEPIARLIFNSGRLPKVSLEESKIIGQILFAYGLSFYFQAIYDLEIRVLYGFKHVIIPTIISLVTVGINAFFNYFLNKLLGLAGIAFSSAVCLMIAVVIFQIFIHNKRSIGLYTNKNLKDLIKVGFASLAMSLWILLSKEMIFNSGINYIVSLFVGITVAIIIYFISAYVLKIKEFDYIIKFIVKKLKAIHTKKSKQLEEKTK